MPSHGDRKSKLRNSCGSLHRLVDDAPLLVVVADLDEAGQREVLAQRMAVEAVVGEDAAKVGIAGEQDAVEIVGFALEPVAAGKTSLMDGTGVSSSVATLMRMRAFLRRAEEVIDDVEARLAARPVDAADVDEGDEAQRRIVAQRA